MIQVVAPLRQAECPGDTQVSTYVDAYPDERKRHGAYRLKRFPNRGSSPVSTLVVDLRTLCCPRFLKAHRLNCMMAVRLTLASTSELPMVWHSLPNRAVRTIFVEGGERTFDTSA